MSGNKSLLISLMFHIFHSCKCKSGGMVMFWTLGAMVSISFEAWKARSRKRYPPVQQVFSYLSSFLDILIDLLPCHARDSTTHPWQWCIGCKACETCMWSWYFLFTRNLILFEQQSMVQSRPKALNALDKTPPPYKCTILSEVPNQPVLTTFCDNQHSWKTQQHM